MPRCSLTGSPALPSDVPDLPTGLDDPDADVLAAADATWARIAAGDGDIRAFMPEEGRRTRLAAEAARLAQQWPAAASRPALFGVPVGIKDVFRVDGLPITAGSALPPDLLAGPESVAVRRLRSAGALVAGKTVTAEFAMVAPGATGNPRDLERTPGGSSSGSAAAVAAGLVPLALGTQTIASVIRPAAYCGVAGFRPARGRILADGVIPFAPSLDVVGCFAVSLAGLARAAAVLCSDWQPEAGPDTPPALGIPAGPYLERASRDALAAFARQAESLAAAGYRVHDVAVLADMDQVEQLIVTITRYEAARVHARWFDRYGSLYRAGTAAVIQHGRTITDREYAGALAHAAELARRLAGEAERAGVDAWITPAATGPAPHGLASTGDPVMSMPWSLACLPALTLPAGLVDGMPVGVQVVAATGTDELLLRWAAGLEATLAGCLDRPA
jgi:Asp-tRNA(Asn)/Glu-tRNA(Gln) amidotransferase A subunit family amidase